MDGNRFRVLGRTGLKVGRLGVACSYGAPTAAFEEAFEQGVNYLEEMRQALKALQRGPLSGDELKRAQRIGDHVHANYRRFFG